MTYGFSAGRPDVRHEAAPGPHTRLGVLHADLSADDFHFTRNTTYPSAIADFERGFAVLERLQCDILLTPHPGASALWERLAARDAGTAGALIDFEACSRYAAASRQRLARRIAAERASH